MHRKPETDLLPLNTEIEITLQNLRRITSTEFGNMANQRERLQVIPEKEEEVERNQWPKAMEDFWMPIIQEEYSIVRQPEIEANNFELKPALITVVHQHQFTGHPFEDPNEHMALDLDRITIRLMLSLGSNSNNSSNNIGTIEENIRVKKGLNLLKIRCYSSWGKTKEF